MANFREVWEDIQDTHRQIWPGQPVPSKKTKDRENLVVPTSVVFAILVWAVSAPRRSPSSRERASTMFASLMRRCVEYGVTITFPVFDDSGAFESLRHADLDPDHFTVNFWTDSLSKVAALTWDMELQNPKLSVPTTPRDAASLSDLVLWALKPVPINCKNETLKKCKKTLTVTALTALTHLVLHLETVVLPEIFKLDARLKPHDSDSDDEYNVNAKKRKLKTMTRKKRHTSTIEVNEVAARAAKLLYTGKAQ